MIKIKIKDVKRGDYFMRKETAKVVYVRGEYDRSSKNFTCHAFDDISKFIYLAPNKEVFTDFTF